MKVLADFELLPAEKRLVEWLQAGNRKVFELSESVPDGPGDAVTLRATFIRYLALGGCDACRLPETGLRVRGAYIDGEEDDSEFTRGLDLEGTTLPHDLALTNCYIPDPIILRSAKIKNLFLDDSELKDGLAADRLQAEGCVHMRRAKVSHAVRLSGASIKGDLDLSWAKLQATTIALSDNRPDINDDPRLKWPEKHLAVVANNIEIAGTAFFKSASIEGEVHFLGAHISGDFVCEGATITSVERAALATPSANKRWKRRQSSELRRCINKWCVLSET